MAIFVPAGAPFAIFTLPLPAQFSRSPHFLQQTAAARHKKDGDRGSRKVGYGAGPEDAVKAEARRQEQQKGRQEYDLARDGDKDAEKRLPLRGEEAADGALQAVEEGHHQEDAKKTGGEVEVGLRPRAEERGDLPRDQLIAEEDTEGYGEHRFNDEEAGLPHARVVSAPEVVADDWLHAVREARNDGGGQRVGLVGDAGRGQRGFAAAG